MDNSPSIAEMWSVIEKFGIKRDMLDLHDNLSYEQIHNLYVTIKNSYSSTEGNSKKNRDMTSLT